MLNQEFLIRINGGHRGLSQDQVAQMVAEAFMVYFQDDNDYKEPIVSAKLVSNIEV